MSAQTMRLELSSQRGEWTCRTCGNLLMYAPVTGWSHWELPDDPLDRCRGVAPALDLPEARAEQLVEDLANYRDQCVEDSAAYRDPFYAALDRLVVPAVERTVDDTIGLGDERYDYLED